MLLWYGVDISLTEELDFIFIRCTLLLFALLILGIDHDNFSQDLVNLVTASFLVTTPFQEDIKTSRFDGASGVPITRFSK
jgi:hypothetical protein